MLVSLARCAIGAALLLGLVPLAGCTAEGARAAGNVQRAVAVLVPVGNSGVDGQVSFDRVAGGVHVVGEVRGLEPGLHGFHVHEFGDLSDRAAGKSAGGHFAPRGNPHGRPSDSKRHVGDLGNIRADDHGVAKIDLTDDTIQLEGPYSIVGRGLVVHAGEDDFSQPTGAAGARVAFGVIGIAERD